MEVVFNSYDALQESSSNEGLTNSTTYCGDIHAVCG